MSSGLNALHICANKGDQGFMDILLTKGKANINELTSKGKSALMLAIEANQIEIIPSLISNKIDINHQDEIGLTALHYACKAKSVESIKKLLEAEIITNSEDNEGRTPLILSVIENAVP